MAKKRNMLSRIGGFLRRSIGAPIGAKQLYSQLFGWLGTKSGQAVSADTALQATAVLACVRVISEDTAKTPFVVRRRDAKGQPWKVDEDHWLTKLMRRPNDWMTGSQFRQLLTAHAALAGDGYAFINRKIGAPERHELLPFPPGAVRPEWALDAQGRSTWEVQYRVTWKDGRSESIPREAMFRLRGFIWDALLPSEVYRLAREAIGISLATEESHAKLHKNGVRLSGILTTGPQAPPLSEQSSARIAKQWKENFGPGSPEEFGVAVLEGGMKFEPMSMTGVDAEHLATRAFQVEEVCRAMRVYPPKIGHFGKSNTFNAGESLTLAHDSDTVEPWALRWSEAVEMHFMGPSAEPNTWASFDIRGLRRGDAKARAAYYNSGIHAGWLSRNEAREMEGFEPKDGLDEFLQPVQLAPGNSADASNEKNASTTKENADED